MSEWYGKHPTIEEVKEATASLREAQQKNKEATKKNQYFDVRRGQAVRSRNNQGQLVEGQVAVILADSPNHRVLVHTEPHLQYAGYSGNWADFDPADEQEINRYFEIEAVIEDEPEEVEPVDLTEPEPSSEDDDEPIDNQEV